MRFALGLCVLFCSATASAAPWFWQRGGTHINDLARATDGSVAVVVDGHLVMFAPDGKVRKQHAFSPTAGVSAIAYAPDQDLLVAGQFQKATFGGTTFTATKNVDSFIARYKPDGSLRWVVRIKSEESVSMRGVAVIADRVIATGRTRSKALVGPKEIPAQHSFVVVLDASGSVLSVPQQLDLGNHGELRRICAAGDGFVTVGVVDRLPEKPGLILAVTKDGATRWTHKSDYETFAIACRDDGTSFAAARGQDSLPHNHSHDVVVYELDRTGKLVRELRVITEVNDHVLHVAASSTEVVVSTLHSDGLSAMWSRVTRFGADGTQLDSEDFKGTVTIDVHAMPGPRGPILVGEITKGSAKIRGKTLAGPTLFVMAP